MMKKLIVFILLSCLLISNNASAISYGNSDTIYLITANSWATVPGSNPVVPFASGDALVYTIPNNGTVTDFSFGLERALSNNAHVISFTLNFNFGQSSQALYRSPQWQDGVTLFDSCVGGMNPSGSYVKTSFSCHYTVLITGAIYQLRTVPNLTWISNIPTGSGGNLEITVSPISSIPLVNSDLSSSDIQQLSSNITSALEDLEISVEGSAGATPEQIEDATKSAIEETREDEKSEYEEQQEGVSDGASDAGDEADAATSTLIDTGKDIIETIRDTPATNCVIRIKSGAFDTGNLNLCNVPQPIRTVISTIITIPVTLAALHIAYSVIMLYLNTVRKEQE